MFEIAIVKLTAFCNLNCSYCYMFNQADRTYERVPRVMSLETALLLLDRIDEYARAVGRTRFSVTLHGGEPTLWPLAYFRAFLARVEVKRRAGLDLRIGMQSNGLRLRRELLELLDEYRVSLGISIDGPAASNDRHRVTHAGQGSYERVMRTVSRMYDDGHGGLIQGFLSVADPDTEPASYLAWADELPIRRLDVLWPLEFNYRNPPWPHGQQTAYRRDPRFGKWFAELFELWWARDDPTLIIRLFYDTVMSMLGAKSHIENLVNDRVPMFVVNTDGGVEHHDFFRSFADGATRTPYNITDHPLQQLHADPTFNYLLSLKDHLPTECGDCTFHALCGGGFLAGRTGTASALPQRRSVLCFDQYYFFRRVLELVTPQVLSKTTPLSAARVAFGNEPDLGAIPAAITTG